MFSMLKVIWIEDLILNLKFPFNFIPMKKSIILKKHLKEKNRKQLNPNTKPKI